MICPDTIYIHITKKCNLKCVYCYFSSSHNSIEELSPELLGEISEDIYSLQPRRVVVTGGEPLLHKYLFEWAYSFKKMNQETMLAITTNGTLITPENIKELVDSFDEIRISIDGSKEVNDQIRGKGTYEKALQSLLLVRDAGGNPSAFITASSANLGSLDEFMEYLISNGICRIHISPINIVGKASSRKDLVVNQKDIENIVTNFWKSRFGIVLKHEKADCVNCGLGRYITIYPDGSVYPCHLLAFPELRLGNIKNDHLESIIDKSKTLDILQKLDFTKLSEKSFSLRRLFKKDACVGRHVQDEKIRKEFFEFL